MFTNLCRASLSLFPREFYIRLLNKYPSYVPIVIKQIKKYNRGYVSYENKYVKQYMKTHDIETLLEYTKDIDLVMKSIYHVYMCSYLFNYYIGYEKWDEIKYLETLTQYCVIIKFW